MGCDSYPNVLPFFIQGRSCCVESNYYTFVVAFMNRLISMVTGMGRPSHLPRRQPFNLSWLAESPEKLRNLIGELLLYWVDLM